MINKTYPVKRTKPIKKGRAGLKALIMAASLGATICGWGILAFGQAQNATAANVQPQPATVQSTNSSTQSTLRSTNATTTLRPVTQPRSITRTRSSR